MEAEYGSAGNVRFVNPENVRMYDSAGEVILCKCGKPGGMAATGKESFIAWCSDCYPYYEEAAQFIYEERKTGKQMLKIIEDSWIFPLNTSSDM